MTAERRMAAEGLTLPPLPRPNGRYALTREAGGLLYVAGQTPTRDGQLVLRGTVGLDVSVEEARAAAGICALNVLAIVAAAASGGLARVRLIRVAGFVRCVDAFDLQPHVIDGASEIFQLALGERGEHVRTAVGTNALPRNAPVEIETVFELVP